VLLRRIRALLDAQPGERVAVGEVVLLDPDRLAAYHGTPDQPELHLAFNFSLLYAPWRSDAFGSVIDRTERAMSAVGAWPTWALGNHDLGRIATRYGSPGRARAAAVLLLSLRGTPFVYAGDELGLADADVPAGRAVDPGGRDGCRAPIPWTTGPGHGWTADPWLPFPPDAEAQAVDRQRADPTSTLALYRRLLARRRACAALHAGDFEWVLDHGADGVLAWRRTAGAEVRLVIVNFRAERREVTVDGAWVVESASDDPAVEGRPFDGVLAPDRAVVLAPAGAPT
jgi:alpha-glucosidase